MSIIQRSERFTLSIYRNILVNFVCGLCWSVEGGHFETRLKDVGTWSCTKCGLECGYSMTELLKTFCMRACSIIIL